MTPSPISAKELERLEELERAATAGPWVSADITAGEDADCGAWVVEMPGGFRLYFGDMADNTGEDIANGNFIAAIRNAAPTLLESVRVLTEERDRINLALSESVATSLWEVQPPRLSDDEIPHGDVQEAIDYIRDPEPTERIVANTTGDRSVAALAERHRTMKHAVEWKGRAEAAEAALATAQDRVRVLVEALEKIEEEGRGSGGLAQSLRGIARAALAAANGEGE